MTDTTATPLRPVTTRLRLRGGESCPVAVLGEPTANPHLVVIPGVAHGLSWTGSFVLLHVPTGRSVSTGDAVVLRDLAERLSGLDWSFTDDPPADLRAAVYAAVRAAAMTEPSGQEFPAHDAWGRGEAGGGLPRLAQPLIAEFLDDYQSAHNRTVGPDAIPLRVPDPDNPDGRPNPDWDHAIMAKVHDYGLAYLLAALHRIDPEVADSAAAALADAWDDGDGLGEWVYQWRQELAAGRPLTLPGIPGDPGEILGRTPFPATTDPR